MCTDLIIKLPSGNCICIGDKIKLSRFDNQSWTVKYDWYDLGGNSPILCWYLDNGIDTKPLTKRDLDDCYLIE